MIYNKDNICIKSDFNIRTIREEDNDIDIIIPINNRTLNLYIKDMPSYISSRFQFQMIKNIIIRFNKSENNNICTVHLLRNIDLQSAVMNFEMDYNEKIIYIEDKEYYIDMKIGDR